MKVLLIVYDEEISFDPSRRGYARKRPGIMAADLVWETERVNS